jgi:murein DD-endopeptidase MepM/ murein hydrolase activator NlpD
MSSEEFNQFLNKLSLEPIPAIDSILSINKYIKIDISKKNKDLLNFDVASAAEWDIYINSYLKKNEKDVAFGGYIEKRNLYDRSDYFKKMAENEKRNIHLGVDLWCEENTKVLAILDGEVHSFKNNNNHGDYGPTVILKHQIDNEIFYTLYGHLSLISIENMIIGDTVLKGDCIGFLGGASVNGEYAPHLHFQIIKDLQGNFGDYPGVSSEKNIAFYKTNCPDPNLLLKLESQE